MHAKSIARGAIALAAFTVGVAFASETPSPTSIDKDAPIVLAQASATMSAEAVAPSFPAHEARVRAAAAQGPEALRRYIHRTRMIWNFYYWDFASKS